MKVACRCRGNYQTGCEGQGVEHGTTVSPPLGCGIRVKTLGAIPRTEQQLAVLLGCRDRSRDNEDLSRAAPKDGKGDKMVRGSGPTLFLPRRCPHWCPFIAKLLAGTQHKATWSRWRRRSAPRPEATLQAVFW